MTSFTGSGIDGQFGYAAETTYGTYKAPNRWAEILPGETLQRKQDYLRPSGINPGAIAYRGKRTVATSRGAAGNVALEVPDGMFGGILNLLHGETVTPVQEEATKVYKQVHKVGTTDPSGKSVTMQLGRPNIEGTITPFSYLGCVLLGLDFACSVDSYLTATLNVNARDSVIAEALGAFAPTAGVAGFNWANAVVKVNSVEQKFLRGVAVKFARGAETGRRYLGEVLQARPLTNAFETAMVELTADYQANTLLEMFNKGEAKSVEIEFPGRTIEAKKTTVIFKFPECRFEGDEPNVANLGALQQTIPLQAEYNGSEPLCEITYKSEDSAL